MRGLLFAAAAAAVLATAGCGPGASAPSEADASAAENTAGNAVENAVAIDNAIAVEAPPAPVAFNAENAVAVDPAFSRRQRRLEALVENAKVRDPLGDAEAKYRAALPQRRRCADAACLTAWYARQEASLSQWEGADEILGR